MDRQELDGMTREELVALAEQVGAAQPRVLTRAELTDEIISRTATDDRDRARARGWLGRARDLLASVVERGLHLPEVAQVLRTTPSPQGWPLGPPPLATLTLAEIYAAQGHTQRAIAVLDEVLARTPEHHEASRLRERLVSARLAFNGGPESPPNPQETALEQRTGLETELVRESEIELKQGIALEPEVVMEPRTTQESQVTREPQIAAERQDESAGRDETADVPAASPPRQAEEPVAALPDEPVTVRRPTKPIMALGDEPVTVRRPMEPAAPLAAADAMAVPRASCPVAAPSAEAEAEATASPETPAETGAPASLAAAVPPGPGTALQERYDVDEVVAIAVDPRTLYVYWEVRPATLARARGRHAQGVLVVRVVGVTPTWDGPAVTTRDLQIEALHGDQFVHDVEPGSRVRVSVGWLAQGNFEPFAVGIELSAPHLRAAEPIAHGVGRWSAEAPREAASAAALAPAVGSPNGSASSLPVALREIALGEMRRLASAWSGPTATAAPAPGASFDAATSTTRTFAVEAYTLRRVGSSELIRAVERTLMSERGARQRSMGQRGGASELGRGSRGSLPHYR